MPQLPGPYRVVVADDDAGFRAALGEVLGADHRFVVVGETDTGAGLADLAEQARAHVVLLDVRMPEGGPPAVAAITQRRELAAAEFPRVCALSAQTSPATISAMVGAGATGFLAKGSVGNDLPDLLARCAAGEVVLAVPGASDALAELLGDAWVMAAR